jgi:hypothetical protein
VAREGHQLDDYQYLVDARTAMFDDLVWWWRALKAARTVDAAAGA